MSITLQTHVKAISSLQPAFTLVKAGFLQRKCACGQHTVAGGECEECRQKREGLLQRAGVSNTPVNAVPPIVHDVISLHGQPLDAGTRAFMEPRFRHDFSQVRVHTDARAAESARSVNALAYTVGSDVVFSKGMYAPETSEGKRLLAHELTHVVQQGSLNAAQDGKLTIGSSNAKPEEEANIVTNTIGNEIDFGTQQYAPKASAGKRSVSYVTRQPPGGAALQRQERGTSVRFPTLEVAALRSSGAFAVGRSPLTSAEMTDASSIFGSSIDLSRVGIVYSPIISAPTTLGNDIRVPPSYAIPRRVLIHELTHIWQFQTKGSAYISDSVFHQTAASLSSFFTTGKFDRSGAYRYQIVPGKSFHDYTAEQQASIVEDYFAYQSLRGDPGYESLIAEVRAASPVSASPEFFEEQAAGLPPRGQELPPIPGTESPREGGGNIPQIQIRFRGL